MPMELENLLPVGQAQTVFPPEPFHPPALLRSANAQTLWSPIRHRTAWLCGAFRDVPTPDGDFVRLHTFLPPQEPVAAVLVLHGLEGSVESSSVQLLCDGLLRRGFACHVLEFRGCGRAPLNRARRLYHSGETTDAGLVLDLLAAEPLPLHAVAMSMGANVLGRLLAERGDTAPVRSAALISTPFVLAEAARAVDRAAFGLYQRVFLRTLLPKALAKERQYPGCIDAERVRHCRTIVEYDNLVTAPLHGFRDADDYYTRCSCGPVLGAIRVPTLLVSSLDDPLVPAHTFPHRMAAESQWLHALPTESGGHLGFIGRDWRAWHPDVVARFLRSADLGLSPAAIGATPNP